jgi:hypothetical protein
MHVHSLFAGAFALTGASATEPQIFHTAVFPDATTVDLAMVSAPSTNAEYDFDVWITATERSPSGEIAYRDASRHAAKVRCDPPLNVSIGGNDYPVLIAVTSYLAKDWKSDLWLTLCRQPLS